MITQYADLVIEVGVALQKGQSLYVNCDAGTYFMAREIAKSAYRHKAKFVYINISDNELLASRLANQNLQELGYNPDFEKMLDYQICTEEWANIQIEPIDDMLKHVPLNPGKNQFYRKSNRAFHHVVRDRRMADKLPWCVIACPTERWAKQVLGPQACEEDLWKVLIPILLLDKPDPTKAWFEKSKMMKDHTRKLNNLGITKLHYQSSQADLTVGLCKTSMFMGADSTLPDGRLFLPNIPTEELFTTPDRNSAEGYITTSRPVTVFDEVTEKVTLHFHEGKVCSFEAVKGKEVMERFLAFDEGTSHLGECALVDEENPIAKSGLVFSSSLYDENASCHLALGAGYISCLAGSSDPYREGCNKSLMHIDFMVGSRDMRITATKMDGREIPFLIDGKFVL